MQREIKIAMLPSMILQDHFSSTIKSKFTNNLPTDEQFLDKGNRSQGSGEEKLFFTIKHQLFSAFTRNMAKEQ